MATETKTLCPNCNAEIKSPILGNDNLLIEGITAEFINKFTDTNSPNYCTKCSKDLLYHAHKEYDIQRKSKSELEKNSTSKIMELIDFVPIVTLHSPLDWKYQSIEIVSAQSVTGTGVITEIASSWTDFFGKESGRYNEKIKKGEDNCKSILRFQALQLGGNAILGTDIDYSEAGAGKGMLMVCMAGTAVKINNLAELNYNVNALNDLEKLMTENKESESEMQIFSKFESLHKDYVFINGGN
jgi:uncharacterized protein YbjQ (UPF0145 family)